MCIENKSLKEIVSTINATSSKKQILDAANRVANTIKRKIDIGAVEFACKAHKSEINMCNMSLRGLDPENDDDQLLDEFNELVERLFDCLELAKISI